LQQGRSFFIYPFRVIYLLVDALPGDVPVQVAVSVKKKTFKHAVTRNLVKRRFRESWRLHKADLNTDVAREGKSMYILMVYGAGEVIPFSEIDGRMVLIMQRLRDIITTGPTP
jgi:ribonuclease P protein component